MKKLHPLVCAAIVLLLFTPAALRAQTTYSNLTVTGTGDFQGQSAMFGTWGNGGGGPGLTLNFADTASGTVPTQINFIGSGTLASWGWWQNTGVGSPQLSLQLDQNNQLIIYTGGSAGVTLNPSATGTSTLAGNLTVNGANNQLPNQTLVNGSSILTEGLGDGRYVPAAYLALATGSSVGASGPAYSLLGEQPQH